LEKRSEGTAVPSFISLIFGPWKWYLEMINESNIRPIVNDVLQGTECFLVELVVAPGAKILVELDSPSGVTIEQLRKISRAIENQLDREKEDFELTVSSPGLEKPFRVFEQYLKNVGRSLTVDLNDGRKLEGKLEEATEKGIVLESSSREKVEGKKSKQDVVRRHEVGMNEIKQAKVLITFK